MSSNGLWHNNEELSDPLLLSLSEFRRELFEPVEVTNVMSKDSERDSNTTAFAARLGEIAWRATPPAERPILGEPSPTSTPETGWEQKWLDALGLDEPGELEERFALDGWSPAEARARVASGVWPETVPLPEWTRTLAELTIALTEPGSTSSGRRSDSPQAFEDVLLPLVDHARDRLFASYGVSEHPWRPTAMAGLEHELLRRLSSISALALGRSFHLFRARRRLFAVGEDPMEGRRHRDAFLESLSRGGMWEFWLEYPVLARLVATTVDGWLSATAELRHRLDRDLTEIAREVFVGEMPGALIDVRCGLSDPHHGQRSVCLLRFECGRELVYKPRSLASDSAFYCLQEWFDEKAPAPGLLVPRLVDRGTHGWMERIRPEPCTTASDVNLFFERAGVLLCLAYLTQATDLHSENIFACGPHPVLIDLETATHPLLQSLVSVEERIADTLADDIWSRSVARTGLLPEWESGEGGRSFDVGGLGAARDQSTGELHPDWEDVDSDGIRLVWREGVVRASHNLPILGGERIPPTKHASAIQHGFASAYEVLLRHADELQLPAGPLAALSRVRMRYVFRPTRQYLSVLSRLHHPEFLRDAFARAIEIERMAVALQDPATNRVQSAHWGIYRRERQALEGLDVPHFSVDPGSRDIWDANEIAACDFLEASCDDVLRESLQRLDAEDCRRQVEYLEALLYAYGRAERSTVIIMPSQPLIAPESPAESFALEVRRIADAISDGAIRAQDGSLNWICLTSALESGRLRVQPMGHKLYSGRAGVAAFLAVADRLGCGDHGDAVRGALQPLRSMIRHPKMLRRFADTVTIGAGDGLAGMVYALVVVGDALGDASMLEDATVLASALTDERIDGSEDNDVLSGRAGVIFGLLPLLRATGERGVLDRIRRCAEQLTAQIDVPAPGQRMWSARGDLSSHGFAHGTVGIAAALVRVGQMVDDERYIQAGRDGFRFEFAGLRDGLQRHRQPHAWCNGMPGLLLAMMAVGQDMIDVEGLDSLLTALRAEDIDGPDHVCCGHMGRAEALMIAGHALKREELVHAATRVAAGVLARRRANGGFALHARDAAHVQSPSFFQGTAGIGYGLMRLIAPGRVPSVLLFERR